MDKAVQQHPDKQVSTTDPDSRLMKTQGMTRMVCYNVLCGAPHNTFYVESSVMLT